MASHSHFGFRAKTPKGDLLDRYNWENIANPTTEHDRLHLCHLPTPLEPMDRLSRNLGGPHVFIKRDDCTGFVTGGSSARKLEFLMADAIAKRSTIVVTPGFLRSDYTLQTAAAARKLDMKCILTMEEDRSETRDTHQQELHTLWLDHLYGAEIHYFPTGSDLDASANQLGDQWYALGQPAYVIPRGGFNPVGALGCVNLAIELADQVREQGLRIDCLVLASDSGTTQAGLIVGFQLATMPIRVLGISVNGPKLEQEARIYNLVCELWDYLRLKRPPSKSNVVVNSDYANYGQNSPAPDTLATIAEVAQRESILLDPAYTGRAMGGLIDLIVNKRQFSTNENILFLHTDGVVGLFRYPASFAKTLTSSGQV